MLPVCFGNIHHCVCFLFSTAWTRPVWRENALVTGPQMPGGGPMAANSLPRSPNPRDSEVVSY